MLSSPQRRLLRENQRPAPTIQDYKYAIQRQPGALEHLLRKAKKSGFSTADLDSLLRFALAEKIINMNKYKLLIGELDLQKTRRYRDTGKLDKRDTAIYDDDDDEQGMTVKCARCKQNVLAAQADFLGGAWVHKRCPI